MTVLVAALMNTSCAYHSQSRQQSEDDKLRQKLIGEWTSSLSISTNKIISCNTIIRSDGSFTAHNDIRDGSGHLLRVLTWSGTFVVTNRAVACTITQSSETNAVIPRTVTPEPILRLDDHERVILNESGMKVVSRRVSH